MLGRQEHDPYQQKLLGHRKRRSLALDCQEQVLAHQEWRSLGKGFGFSCRSDTPQLLYYAD